MSLALVLGLIFGFACAFSSHIFREWVRRGMQPEVLEDPEEFVHQLASEQVGTVAASLAPPFTTPV